MDAGFNIYELDDEQKKVLNGEVADDEVQLRNLELDVARMNGYLKGRADSDKSSHERLIHDSTGGRTFRNVTPNPQSST